MSISFIKPDDSIGDSLSTINLNFAEIENNYNLTISAIDSLAPILENYLNQNLISFANISKNINNNKFLWEQARTIVSMSSATWMQPLVFLYPCIVEESTFIFTKTISDAVTFWINKHFPVTTSAGDANYIEDQTAYIGVTYRDTISKESVLENTLHTEIITVKYIVKNCQWIPTDIINSPLTPENCNNLPELPPPVTPGPDLPPPVTPVPEEEDRSCYGAFEYTLTERVKGEGFEGEDTCTVVVDNSDSSDIEYTATIAATTYNSCATGSSKSRIEVFENNNAVPVIHEGPVAILTIKKQGVIYTRTFTAKNATDFRDNLKRLKNASLNFDYAVDSITTIEKEQRAGWNNFTVRVLFKKNILTEPNIQKAYDISKFTKTNLTRIKCIAYTKATRSGECNGGMIGFVNSCFFRESQALVCSYSCKNLLATTEIPVDGTRVIAGEFIPGTYEVRYTKGGWVASTAKISKTNPWLISPIQIYYGAGKSLKLSTVYTVKSNDITNLLLSNSKTIIHSGGSIEYSVVDSPGKFKDNSAHPAGPPTYSICRIGPLPSEALNITVLQNIVWVVTSQGEDIFTLQGNKLTTQHISGKEPVNCNFKYTTTSTDNDSIASTSHSISKPLGVSILPFSLIQTDIIDITTPSIGTITILEKPSAANNYAIKINIKNAGTKTNLYRFVFNLKKIPNLSASLISSISNSISNSIFTATTNFTMILKSLSGDFRSTGNGSIQAIFSGTSGGQYQILLEDSSRNIDIRFADNDILWSANNLKSGIYKIEIRNFNSTANFVSTRISGELFISTMIGESYLKVDNVNISIDQTITSI